MVLRASVPVLLAPAGRRPRLITSVITLGLAALLLTGCTVTAGSAVLVGGTSISESSVQAATAAFVAENATSPATDAQTSSVNRSQITYLVRHALIAKAAAARGIVVTNAQLAAVRAQVAAQTQDPNLGSLELPASEQADAIHDLAVIEAIVAALPAAGAEVQNVSVTAEGVAATTRDEAVALRSKFLSDPATMDSAVAAAGSSGPAPKNAYHLLQNPAVGAVGLYRSGPGAVVILPNATGFLVLRTTGRTVAAAALTQNALGSASNWSDIFDLASLLLAPYQDGAGISVNPRYGLWDPATLQVVPGNDGL